MLENGNARLSQVHSDDGHGPVPPQNQPASGYIRQQRRASKRVVAMVLFQSQFGSLWKNPAECERPRQHGSGLSQKFQEYGQRKNVNSQKGPRPGNVDANTCNNCGTSGHWAKDWRKPGGDANYSSNSGFHKGKGKGKVKGERAKGKQGTLCRQTAILARVTLRKRHRCLFLHRLQVLQFW